MPIDRQPVGTRYCEGQRLSKKVAPADRAGDGGILAPQDFAVSDDNQGSRLKVNEAVSAASACYLRLTEVAGDKTDEKFRDPCSSRSAEVIRRAPVAHVFNSNGESSSIRYGSAIAAYALDVECEIIGSKSEAHDFRRKRELVPAGQQVMAAFAAKKWLSFLAETQVNRLGHRRNVALFTHDSSPVSSYPWPML